jgi:hypothetical protein
LSSLPTVRALRVEKKEGVASGQRVDGRTTPS